MGPVLQAEDLPALDVEADASQVWFAALRVPARGDAKVPDLAQLVLRARGLLQDRAWARFATGTVHRLAAAGRESTLIVT